MSKTIVPQIYGYAVCLVAVVTLIFSVQSLIDNTFQYTNPEQECTYVDSMSPAIDSKIGVVTDDQTSRQKACVDQAEYRALRSIANSGILTVMALILFIVHWRWLGKIRDEK